MIPLSVIVCVSIIPQILFYFTDIYYNTQGNPSGQQGDNFSSTHEYAYFIYPVPGRSISEQLRENPDDWDKRGLRDVTGDDSLRTAAKTCFYPIYIKNGEVIGFGDVCSDDFHPPINIVKDNGIIEVYPVDPQGVERKWRFGRSTVSSIQEQLIANFIKARDVWDIQRLKKHFNYKTVWQATKYSANNYGTQILNPMFKESPFTYPKSLYTVQDCINAGLNGANDAVVLDYFAGSGTTGQAVMNLNQKGRNIKYILVEMGTYFNKATLPRIKKCAYALGERLWKDGKPQNRNTGVSHIMKYMKLESYEDALSNVSLDDEKHGLSSLLGDDYLINYMLDVEAEGSLLKLDSFKSPFEYQLNITENNETKKKNVDIVDTFNYLIGLTVKSVSAITYYNAVKDETGEYEGAVRLVKDIGGNYGFKHIEGTLTDGRRALVIWRTISDNLIESNAALDAYLKMHRVTPTDNEYDVIYVNGDNNLKLKSSDEDGFNVKMIELEFKKKMFEEE